MDEPSKQSLGTLSSISSMPRDDEVVWRRLQPHLWVGRANGSHVGIIEQGRRFTFIDADDRVHPGFPTLSAAQQRGLERCSALPFREPVEPARPQASVRTRPPVAARPRARRSTWHVSPAVGIRATLTPGALALLLLAIGSLAAVSLTLTLL
jgi:hypothetical protein